MQEIKAYIKNHKLEAVTLALHRVSGISGMSVSEVRGFGRSKAHTSAANPIDGTADFVKHVKIEVVCHNQYVDEVVQVLKDVAHTGLRGDGRIFVSDVRRAIRIEDGVEDSTVV
ncbi:MULTISPECIES: P-II family nitrogen regulator [Pseudomonadaceae]|uniref:Nitrogen regulatory protein P-II family n=1 Tax=Halopseudomonas litoralis TaxID=797277 RepID=A0A1H1MPX0_9GAMM|nr:MULTISPECIES: P-II family nitrogen regulator [Pseudomonadaceae]QIB50520.1 P-II family nitrogen regulator [Pseudomonas sp. OIL-1]QJD57572.1 P-II family nitrogen regulator [Pseudomonas sp. gcc21]SDR67922.1 nitrogen regulatory protein P-II family [Halopseudomonas litoralis]SDR88841.1 nitrogen regulatory protein P-II family [Halopseudomonas litoralis]